MNDKKITTQRHKCSFCNGQDTLEKLFCLNNFPVFMGCVDNLDKKGDKFADMTFAVCTRCGGVQLDPFVIPSVVYKNAHGSGTVGATWLLHHQRLAKFISRYAPQEVLEVGASHNLLSKSYRSLNKFTKWEIIDPNPPKNNVDSLVTYKRGFFNENYSLKKKYDCIVHSHTYEHFISVRDMTRKFFDSLVDGGIMVFSIPHLQSHYDQLFTNVMNFEHTVFLSEIMMDIILKSEGFVIEEKQYYQNDHSIFYACRKQAKVDIPLSANLYHYNKTTLLSWFFEHKKMIEKINEQIKDISGKNVYLFPAHVSTQFLIALGLNIDKITGVLDNCENKHGKRLYGTDLICYSPKEAFADTGGVVILRGGVCSKEIEEGIKSKTNNSVEFIRG